VNKRLKSPLMVLVDEVDRAAMRGLLSVDDEEEGRRRYDDAVAAMEGMFGWLKDLAASDAGNRYFITGITPISLSESIFTGSTRVTFDKEFANMLGLTQSDVEAVLEHVAGLDSTTDEFKRTLDVVKRCYNGYYYEMSQEPVYNPQLVLRFAEQYDRFRQATLDDTMLPRKLPLLADDQQELTTRQMRLITRGSSLAAALLASRKADATVEGELPEKLDIETLDDDAYSYLFHAGILTFSGPGMGTGSEAFSLRVPNDVTALMYAEKYVRYVVGKLGTSSAFLNDPSSQTLEALLVMLLEKLRKAASIRSVSIGAENEISINALFFAELFNSCVKTKGVVVSFQNAPGAEGTLRDRMDAEIVTPTLRIIIEFKFCPISKTRKTDNPLRALLERTRRVTGAPSLSNLKVTGMGAKIYTVADLQRSATAQIRRYARGLSQEKKQDDAANNRGLVGFAVSQIADRFVVYEIALEEES